MSKKSKVYQLKLRKAERERLKKLVSKGKHSARAIRRAQVLLMLDQGLTPTQIAQALNISNKSVYSFLERYRSEGFEGIIHEKKRPGAPKKITEKAIAKITALACSTPPEGRSKWTLRLLADQIVELKYVDSISHNQVGQILKKTKLSPGKKNNGA